MLHAVKRAEGTECFAEWDVQVQTSEPGRNWREGARRVLHAEKAARAKTKCGQQERVNR